MKKLIQILVCLSFVAVNAQGKRYNQFSVEAAYGFSLPVNTVSDVSDDSYSSTSHFAFGVRYMFNQDWGIKGQLSIEQYRGDIEDTGTNFGGLDLQAYYNLGNLFDLTYATDERMGLLVHSGFGVGTLKSLQVDIRERVGQITAGVSPRIRINDVANIMLDFSYTLNVRQHFNFDGTYAQADRDYATGSYFNASIGLVINLGSERRHADWY